MGIRLSIEITSPLTPDDRDLLSGIAVMTLAIANRELAQQGFPETFPPDDGPDERTAAACGAPGGDRAGICIREGGHRGRHRFDRPVNLN